MVICSFKQQLQYKWNLLFQVLGDFLRVYIKVSIWQVLLLAESGEHIGFKEMASYSVIGSIVILLTTSRVAAELEDRVRTGMIAVDLIRPVSMKWYYFFGQLGENLYHLFFEGILISLISSLLWKLPLPDIGNIVLFFVSLILGIFIMFYIQYTIGLLVFWMKDGTYTRMITDGLFVLFSGIEIPLWFYPGWLKGICRFLPFRFVVYEPVTIWLGKAGIQETGLVIGMQLIWIIFLAWVERQLWSFIQKSIEIQGG